jgi:hypothetical protein
MENLFKSKLSFFLLAMALGLIFAGACTPILTSQTTSTNNESGPWAGHANKVEIVYFHATQQCATCICFEDRISQIMQNTYSKQIKEGLIIYKVLNFQDPANADLVKKYNVVTSSLCVDRALDDGTHEILNVQDIWYWDCMGKPSNFDQKVKELVKLAIG